MNKFGDWEIIEQEAVGSFTAKIYLLNTANGRVSISRIVDGHIELKELVQGQEEQPTLTINLDIWRYIKASLTDEKIKDKNEVEAELSATKYHLQDLRKLLKLNQ